MLHLINYILCSIPKLSRPRPKNVVYPAPSITSKTSGVLHMHWLAFYEMILCDFQFTMCRRLVQRHDLQFGSKLRISCSGLDFRFIRISQLAWSYFSHAFLRHQPITCFPSCTFPCLTDAKHVTMGMPLRILLDVCFLFCLGTDDGIV